MVTQEKSQKHIVYKLKEGHFDLLGPNVYI